MASDKSTEILSKLDSLFNNINQNTKIDKALINDILYKELIISVKSTCKSMGITPYKAKKLLNTLISEKLITEVDVNKKGKTYILTGIMKIIHDL